MGHLYNSSSFSLFPLTDNRAFLTSTTNDKSHIDENNIDKSNINESNINESNINESNINESNINESNINESNINESNINESNINESNINESKKYTGHVIVSWTGGKDGCLACYRALSKGFEVSHLLKVSHLLNFRGIQRRGSHDIIPYLVYAQSEAL
ncbi:hypothetical protein MSBRW_2736 [Methanosarcina barkeri str. Wiesmoor]|uniref:Diphthamide synthase domain-containing protein n=2 Tax=Methanosarcina barkeri TaxID=2208 RepID=A0A0E3QLU6_METBA|nr:hypothetical protein [Methanosarcina barkeri]AKB51989.1 hypothetical protein MSBRW_2736 [Methanosarcina barkeri str. Wiesmoor]